MGPRVLVVATAVTGVIAAGTQTSWAAPKKAKPAGTRVARLTTAEAAGIALVDLCKEWMKKLEVRERDNLEQIKWEPVADTVQGTYIGYSREHTCQMREGTEHDPVARIVYREVRYKKQGGTIAEAEQSTPEPVEIFEVKELFHYVKSKQKWDY